MTSSVCTLLSGHLIPHMMAVAPSDTPNICLGSKLYQRAFSPYSSFNRLLFTECHFLFLTNSCFAVTLPLLVTLTISSPHRFIFSSVSCSLHLIHASEPKRVEKRTR
ncbi:hypothetical protein XENOCAPTIV_022645 [Xenoophorus captivus]|uniref:Secreted protein n=1 Tax=Xenoophorus captivus TaxID=1517983 RepID=A0ABV0S9L2_9TELE